MDVLSLLAVALLMAALGGWIAIKTGIARRLFFQIYARAKGDELLGPNLILDAPADSPYQRWLARARSEIPVQEGDVLHEIETIPLPPWPALGGGVAGLYLHFGNYQMLDAQIIEIPPGGRTHAQRHLYEKAIYVLHGQGRTRLQQEGRPDRDIAFAEGDLFSVPFNVRHEHFNDGNGPMRFLLVTSFPLMQNLLDDESFLLENAAAFTSRYDAEEGYLEASGELGGLRKKANIVRNVRSTPARENDFRGKGSQSIRWQMAANTVLDMHVSEMPPLMVKRAHRISSNAFVLVLSGTGFSVLWREGQYGSRRRVDWKPGTLFVPPVFWYQQHLNSGNTPARYLAINVPGFVKNIGLHFEDQLEVDLAEVTAEWKKELEKKHSGSN
jgi:gentisate 1,2-dioxygenase